MSSIRSVDSFLNSIRIKNSNASEKASTLSFGQEKKAEKDSEGDSVELSYDVIRLKMDAKAEEGTAEEDFSFSSLAEDTEDSVDYSQFGSSELTDLLSGAGSASVRAARVTSQYLQGMQMNSVMEEASMNTVEAQSNLASFFAEGGKDKGYSYIG